MHKSCFPPCLFESLAGTCGGGVLGIVSPALPDDPDSLSTNPSVKGWSHSERSCSRSPEAVGARSSDAASASLRGLLSKLTAGTTIGRVIVFPSIRGNEYHILRTMFLAKREYSW